MKPWTRVALAAGTVLVLATTGCSSGSGKSEQASVCSEACSGKEVTDTGCDKQAVDAVAAKAVRVSDELHGKLGVRKSNPAACSGIYWVKFTPDADSTAAFEVTIAVDGRVAQPQPSEPGNPTLEAWTVGVHAKPDAVITACLVQPDTKKAVCLADTKAA